MSMSLALTGLCSNRNLVCGICQDVFRSPRMLPYCHHSFCLHCLEDMHQVHGHRFPCPTCRETVHVPPGGVHQFKVNFYIAEEELDRERNVDKRAMCPIHPTVDLIFFCTECDQSICWRCKLTKHEGHRTEDLTDASARAKLGLLDTKKRLEDTLKQLNKNLDLVQDNLNAALEKGDLLKEQVHDRYAAIVDRAAKLRDKTLRGLDKKMKTMEKEMTTDVKKVQQHLDTVTQLQQRVTDTLDSDNDSEIVAVEMEMRKEQKIIPKLDQIIIRSLPTSTQRPGLRADRNFLKYDYMKSFYGSPVRLELPCSFPLEIIEETFTRKTTGGRQEIRAVHRCRIGDCSGTAGYQHGELTLMDDSGCIMESLDLVRSVPVTFSRWRRQVSSLQELVPEDNSICANSNVDFIAVRDPTSAEITIQPNPRSLSVKQPKVLYLSETETLLCFDAKTWRGELDNVFVVLSEKSLTTRGNDCVATEIGDTTRSRTVHLYRDGQREAVCNYEPPRQPFFPTSVCFWTTKDEELLLIADMMTDSIHVVRVEGNGFCFLRYLAAGSPDLVSPTALDVYKGVIWIGCANGWILGCESLSDFTFGGEVKLEYFIT